MKFSRLSWRPLLIVLVVAILAGIVVWRLHSSAPQQQAGRRGTAAGPDRPPVPVVVTSAVQKDVPVYLDGLGTVQAYNTVTVHSRIDGQLNEVGFREGQDVHKDDVLARIDPRTYQAQYEQSTAQLAKDQAQLEGARLDLNRYVSLGTKISAQTVDTQRATVKQLEAQIKIDQAAIDSTKTMLAYTIVTAPIDGRTGIRQVDAGNIIHAGDANGLVVITQLQPISVLFTLPQQNLNAINIEQAKQGQLNVEALDSDSVTILDEGKLELVDNQIDQNTGTAKLKATFPNAKRILWPGGFINVRLLLNTRTGVTVVPTVAIQHGPKGAYVFTVTPDNKAKIQDVKISLVEGDDSVIDSGVSAGDKVVTDGMTRLQNDTNLTFTGADATPAATNGRRNTGRRRGP